jgi:hypothetical protein
VAFLEKCLEAADSGKAERGFPRVSRTAFRAEGERLGQWPICGFMETDRLEPTASGVISPERVLERRCNLLSFLTWAE